jgi:hypothetical protein
MSNPGTPASPLPGLVSWVIASAARHALTGLGGVLVTAGAIQPVQQDQFVVMATGIAVWLAGLAWSAAEKKALTSPPS